MNNHRVAALMDLAVRQHGMLTYAQAASIGVGSDCLCDLTRQGLFVRDRRGLYRLATVNRGQEQTLVGAVLLTGGVLSHRSAAQRYDLVRNTKVTEVTVSQRSRFTAGPLVVVHRARSIDTDDLSEVRGLPVTSPQRTLVDLARPAYRATDAELKMMVSGALHKRLVAAHAFDKQLAAIDARSPGVRRLRQTLEDLTGIMSDSVYEDVLFDLLRKVGLPQPQLGLIIRDEHHEFVAKVDLGWPAERVVLEVDGYSTHTDPRTFEADRVRGSQLVGLGWALLRTTPKRIVREGAEVVGNIRAAIELGRRLWGPDRT